MLAKSSPETAMRMLGQMWNRSDEGFIEEPLVTLGQWAGVGRNTANSALNLLEEVGAIVVIKRGTGAMYPSRYLIPGWEAGDADQVD